MFAEINRQLIKIKHNGKTNRRYPQAQTPNYQVEQHNHWGSKEPILEPHKSRPISHPVSLTPILALSTNLRLGLPSGLLPSYEEMF
jgi:hypothetical protein